MSLLRKVHFEGFNPSLFAIEATFFAEIDFSERAQ